jgi:hypothetical protein
MTKPLFPADAGAAGPMEAMAVARFARADSGSQTGAATRVLLKVLWVTACLAVLAFAWANRASADAEESVAWAMLVLTFPMGLALAAIGTAVVLVLNDTLGINVAFGYGFNLAWWLASCAAAYWWWFIFVPRWKTR